MNFYYICGLLRHTDKVCDARVEMMRKPFSSELCVMASQRHFLEDNRSRGKNSSGSGGSKWKEVKGVQGS